MTEITLNERFQDLISETTPRRVASRIPKKIYFYFPKGTELVEFDEKKPTKTLRRIFEGNVEYLAFEKEKLEGFQKFLDDLNSDKPENEKFKYPDYWTEDMTLRSLQSFEYDYKITLENNIKYIDWRKKTLPIQPSNKICEILNIGFIYTHGRDNRYRPNVVLKVKEFKQNYDKYSFDDWMSTIIFQLEYLIQNLLIKGQIENWNILVECADASVLSLPPEFKKLLQVLGDNYRCRLHTMYILNLSVFLRAIWQLVKNVLDPTTQRKIIVSSSGSSDLFARINKSQLEERFGGTAKNVTDFFFPHIQPSEEFTVEGENENDLLVSEDVYLDMVAKDERIERSPYYVYEDKKNDRTADKIQNISIIDEDNGQIDLKFAEHKNSSVYLNIQNTEGKEDPNNSARNHQLGFSEKNEKEGNELIKNADINSKLASLNYLYFVLLVQMVSALSNLGLIYILKPEVNFFSFQSFFVLLILIIGLLALVRKFQDKIKNDQNIPIFASLALGLVGSLVFMDVKNILLPYSTFISSLIICYLYFKYVKQKTTESKLVFLIIGINTIFMLIIYLNFIENILFLCFSWFASVYFTACLFFYSNFLLYNNNINFVQNRVFYNLLAFTCELFIFPYTFVLDVYYKSYDSKKILNFGFLKV